MAWKHRFTGTWVPEDSFDKEYPRLMVDIKSEAVTLHDTIEAFQSYLKALGYDWTPENNPFSE